MQHDLSIRNPFASAMGMLKLANIVILVGYLIIALGGATLGVYAEAEAAELDLFLGKTSSPTTVYFVSDWLCPVCMKTEPVIEKMYPDIAKLARVSFVDLPFHRETLNFTPFNIQFIAYEKTKYIRLRQVLAGLALKTKNPSEAVVQAAVAPLGVRLRHMSRPDTLYGMQSNFMVYRGYNVNLTPTVVVTNSKTKKTKLIVGGGRITEKAVKSAIEEVDTN